MTTPLESLAANWSAEAASSAMNALNCDEEDIRIRLEAEAETLTACAAELRAEIARGGWQPMGTAPRNGTIIQMWHGGSGLRDRVVVGAFDAKAEHPWRFMDNPFRLTGAKHDGEGMCNAFLTEPTHWRHLSEPPR